jgi:uncharacterized protein YndB with AHSA1/START domain
MRHGKASKELLASREDVWAFFAEPHHLADWWPRMRGVQPDRRGFAPGARWGVMTLERLPLMGWREPKRPVTLVVGEIEPYERWTWHLTGDTPLDAEIRLEAVEPDRTRVTITVTGPALASPKKLARLAVGRLYDLVQTAANR